MNTVNAFSQPGAIPSSGSGSPLVRNLERSLEALTVEPVFSIVFRNEALDELVLYESNLPAAYPGRRLAPTAEAAIASEDTADESRRMTWADEPDGGPPISRAHALRRKGDAFGYLVIHGATLPGAEQSLAYLADHLSIALVNVQVQEMLKLEHAGAVARLNAFGEAGELLMRLRLDTVLPKVVQLALKIAEGRAGCVVLSQPDGSLRVSEQRLTFDALDTLVTSEGEGVLKRALEGFDFHTRRLDRDLRVSRAPQLEGIRCLSVTAIQTRSGRRGALAVVHDEARREAQHQGPETLRTFAGLAGIAIENACVHEQALVQARAQEQLEVAGRVQDRLTPTEAPPAVGVIAAGKVAACDETGGDYLDYFPGPNGGLAVTVGDVTGHGLGAAMLMTTARAAFRAHVGLVPELGRLFDHVNDNLVGDLGGSRFITLAHVVWDPANRTLRFNNAGHDPPLLLRRGSDHVEELAATGPPIGILDGMQYPPGLVEDIQPDDVLLLATDGVWEVFDADGEAFGRERLVDHLRSHRNAEPQELIDSLLAAVDEHRGDAPVTDDITLACLKFQNVETSHSITFPPKTDFLPQVRDAVDSVIARQGVKVSEVETGMLHLLVTELAANIIEHGRTDESISMHISMDRGTLEVRFLHDGVPFDPETVPARSFDTVEEGGLGLPLVSELADCVEYRTTPDGRQEVRMVKRGLPDAPPA